MSLSNKLVSFLPQSRWTNFPVRGVFFLFIIVVSGAALDSDVLVVAAVVVVVPQVRRMALLKRFLVPAAGSTLQVTTHAIIHKRDLNQLLG